MRLYLCAPPVIHDGQDLANQLASIAAKVDIAAFLLDVEKDKAENLIKLLQPLTQAENIAFMVAHDHELCFKTKADGVHLGSADLAIDKARAKLGEDSIIGAICGASRHRAMVAAEQGASYVMLAPDHDLLDWWQETFEVPCVADAMTLSLDQALTLKADFLCLRDAVWNNPQGLDPILEVFKKA